jgi:hypothetical protein
MKKTLIRAILISGISLPGLAPVAWAHHGPQGPLARVRVLADQVEDSTDRLVYLAKRTMPVRGFHQVRGLQAVSLLAREADDFERQVAYSRPSRARTAGDYRRLVIAFDRANLALSRARTSWLVRRELDRVGTLMRRLDRSYAFLVATASLRSGRYQEDPRHGRYLARGYGADLDDDDEGYAEIDTVVRLRRAPAGAATRIDD